MSNKEPNKDLIITHTQEWLVKAVIGLNLCPFAKEAHIKKQIRYVVIDSADTEALLQELIVELKALVAADPATTETTLIIHPQVLTNFLDYNDFLEVADATLTELNLQGVVQIASFHPQYQFAGTSPDDITNYTNRSPYPMLHLLREASVTRAVESYPNVEDVPQKNIETLQRLGVEGWKNLKIPDPLNS